MGIAARSLSTSDCKVIAGLTSLKSLHIHGFVITDILNLSPTATDVSLSACTVTMVTGAGIESFNMSCCTSPQQLDLRCMPALQRLATSMCKGELLLSLPSALETLNSSNMYVAGKVLSQLTCLEILDCKTQSQVVDLRNCTKLRILSIGGIRLTRVDVSDCRRLDTLMVSGSQLNDLRVHGCTQLLTCDLHGCALQRQPFRPGTTWRLMHLNLCASKWLSDVSDLPPSLSSLDLSACDNLIVIPPLFLPELISLDVSFCHNLTRMDVDGCPSLKVVKRYESNNFERHICEAILKSGPRAGEHCTHTSKPHSRYCGIHRNMH